MNLVQQYTSSCNESNDRRIANREDICGTKQSLVFHRKMLILGVIEHRRLQGALQEHSPDTRYVAVKSPPALSTSSQRFVPVYTSFVALYISVRTFVIKYDDYKVFCAMN